MTAEELEWVIRGTSLHGTYRTSPRVHSCRTSEGLMWLHVKVKEVGYESCQKAVVVVELPPKSPVLALRASV